MTVSIGQYDVVVVGAGHGGAQTAVALRQNGFAGTIAIVSDEPDLPYERPPLSKDYLAGDKTFERLLIRPAKFWEDRAITMRLGTPVVSIDSEAHTIALQDGSGIGYRKLVWAAGGTPRRLSCDGHLLGGVHTVRSRADADRMRSELDAVRRAVVIGGGYVGLEAAAVLAKMGKQVIVLEAQDRVLSRVACEPLSRFYENEHRSHGVEIRLNAVVERIEGEEVVAGVRLASGELIPCEMVIVGIGIVPVIEPLRAEGALVGNGVTVDGQCRTSLPNVYAIGDCAAHVNRFAGDSPIRLESVQNANDQAIVVARHLTGQDADYNAIPWFWSNQYDLRLQTIGVSTGYDATLIRNNLTTRSFSILYLREGRLIALDCVNATKDYVQSRGLILRHARVAPALLSDVSIPLNSHVE